jgi:hypothetical protein
MRHLWHLFDLSADCNILDVGGDYFNWMLFSSSPPKVTLLNLTVSRERKRNFTRIVGDGCHLPFRNGVFDLVYSNSVIEHLDGSENQILFAEECRRVGHNYYVQTPNKWFFLEPHLITPFVHWLPHRIKRLLLRNFTIWGWITRPTSQYCDAFMKEICLLDERRLKRLFPEGKIYREYFFGFVKSIIAVNISSQ